MKAYAQQCAHCHCDAPRANDKPAGASEQEIQCLSSYCCGGHEISKTQVRHPGVGRAIARDFALMVAMAKVAELLPSMKRLRLQDSLRQFAAPLQEQVCLALCLPLGLQHSPAITQASRPTAAALV